MKIITTVAPADTPVSISEARDQCSLLDDTTHDALLTRLIYAATSTIENETGSRLFQQTLRLELDGFPDGDIDLGVHPISAVTEVAYDDEAGVEQTLVVTTNYWESLSGNYPKLKPVTTWPATKADKLGSVRVTVTAGYADQASIPQALRHAVLLRVSELFENRDETISGAAVTPTMNTVKNLVSPYRRMVM